MYQYCDLSQLANLRNLRERSVGVSDQNDKYRCSCKIQTARNTPIDNTNVLLWKFKQPLQPTNQQNSSKTFSNIRISSLYRN